MDKNVILAKKYGRAMYELAAEQNCLEQTEKDLRFISETVSENDNLAEILNHPLLAKDVKKDTIKQLFADKVQPVVLQFLYVVIDRGRIGSLAAITDIYASLAHHGMGIEEATVTSALPLTESQTEALKAKLSEMTGSKIILKQKVDASLIGGFIVQVGDRLIDGSVARQLSTLRAQMMQRD